MLHTTATNSTTLDAVASTCPASISLPPNVGLAGACLTSRSAVRVANAQLDNRFFPGFELIHLRSDSESIVFIEVYVVLYRN
jgi:hypothetical protein